MATYSTPAERDFEYGIVFGNHGATSNFDAITLATVSSGLLPVESPIDFKQNVTKFRPNRATGYRQRTVLDTDNSDVLSAPSCSMTIPAIKGVTGGAARTTFGLDMLLYGLLQTSSSVINEGGSGNFLKIFKPVTTTAIPDFSADGGAFFGLIKNAAGGTTPDQGLISAIPTSITFSCYPDQNQGRLTTQIEWTARHFTDAASLTAPTHPASWTYFNFGDIYSITVGGTAIPCYGFSFTVTNGAKQIPANGSSTYGCTNIALTSFDCTGSIDLHLQDETRVVMQGEDASTPVNVVIQWNSVDAADAYLKFTIPCLFDDDSSKGNENCVKSCSFEAVANADTSTPIISVEIGNSIDRSW